MAVLPEWEVIPKSVVWDFVPNSVLEVIVNSVTWEFVAGLPELEVILKSVIWAFAAI